eukprot:2455677-Karenia_brevis.AAC.1
MNIDLLEIDSSATAAPAAAFAELPPPLVSALRMIFNPGRTDFGQNPLNPPLPLPGGLTLTLLTIES